MQMDTRHSHVCGPWRICTQHRMSTGTQNSKLWQTLLAGPAPSSTDCLTYNASFQVFELRGNELQKVQEVERQARFKCGTFGASSLSEKQLAIGSFQGQLQVRFLAGESGCICICSHSSINGLHESLPLLADVGS